MKIFNTPPPQKRVKIKRLTPELTGMKSGESVVVDPKTAAALAAFFRYTGFEARRKAVMGNMVQVWKI